MKSSSQKSRSRIQANVATAAAAASADQSQARGGRAEKKVGIASEVCGAYRTAGQRWNDADRAGDGALARRLRLRRAEGRAYEGSGLRQGRRRRDGGRGNAVRRRDVLLLLRRLL